MKSNLLCLILAGIIATSCGGGSGAGDANEPTPEQRAADSIAAIDAKIEYTGELPKEKAFIVISKRDLRLKVYAPIGGDTVLVAHYPVCLSRNKGNKEKGGDMRTPESPAGKPFVIKQIQDASDWHHDFGDGRGSILAYGHWFLRLETPFSGIGIHGSTNNENTVPGRDSEGCIRLRDADIEQLHDRYAYVGMPVIIQGETDGPLPFELKK